MFGSYQALHLFSLNSASSWGLGQFPGYSGSHVQDALQVWTQPAPCAHVRGVGELTFESQKIKRFDLLLCLKIKMWHIDGNIWAIWAQRQVKSVFPVLALITICSICVYLTVICCKWANFCSVFAVEHTSKERETNRADVWALQHSCLLPLQVSRALCVSFTVSRHPGRTLKQRVQLIITDSSDEISCHLVDFKPHISLTLNIQALPMGGLQAWF